MEIVSGEECKNKKVILRIHKYESQGEPWVLNPEPLEFF